MPIALRDLSFSYNQPTTTCAARFYFQKRYKTVFFTALYPLSHTLSCCLCIVYVLVVVFYLILIGCWIVMVLVLCYSIEMFFWGGGGCCVSGRGCCVSGVGDAASVRGVQHQRKGGCCVSEEGYYKIIWFYFLNC